MFNVDEIDDRCQFHQHFTYKFFVLMSFRQLFLRNYVTREKAAQTTFYEKLVRKMLMKLTIVMLHLFFNREYFCS